MKCISFSLGYMAFQLLKTNYINNVLFLHILLNLFYFFLNESGGEMNLSPEESFHISRSKIPTFFHTYEEIQIFFVEYMHKWRNRTLAVQYFPCSTLLSIKRTDKLFLHHFFSCSFIQYLLSFTHAFSLSCPVIFSI